MAQRRHGAGKQPAKAARASIIYLPVASLAPDPGNPRIHNRQQVRAIARSIQAFGFNAPILIQANGQIVAGHGRLEAAKLLGMTDVPVVRLEHLSEAQAAAYTLADNKLTDRSSWDDTQLALRLKELQAIALDFDIEATGFETPEIDIRVQSLEPADAMDQADEFEPTASPAVSRLGDLWQLGPHRLACGNALDPECYDRLLEGELASAVLTDPPYNVRINGHAGGKGRVKHREFPMAAGEMSRAEFEAFLCASLQQACPRSHKAAVVFVFMDWRHIAEASAALERAGLEIINLCVWVKSNGGMGSLYRSGHELVFVSRALGSQHRNNVQLGSFGRSRTNVWHYAGMNSFARRGRVRVADLHPTVKPVQMLADAILDVTRQGDIVLDPFCGSGTTLLAAERTGRRGYGIELDPLYVDLTVMRWQKMTGQAATCANGRTFEHLRAERAQFGISSSAAAGANVA